MQIHTYRVTFLLLLCKLLSFYLLLFLAFFYIFIIMLRVICFISLIRLLLFFIYYDYLYRMVELQQELKINLVKARIVYFVMLLYHTSKRIIQFYQYFLQRLDYLFGLMKPSAMQVISTYFSKIYSLNNFLNILYYKPNLKITKQLTLLQFIYIIQIIKSQETQLKMYSRSITDRNEKKVDKQIYQRKNKHKNSYLNRFERAIQMFNNPNEKDEDQFAKYNLNKRGKSNSELFNNFSKEQYQQIKQKQNKSRDEFLERLHKHNNNQTLIKDNFQTEQSQNSKEHEKIQKEQNQSPQNNNQVSLAKFEIKFVPKIQINNKINDSESIQSAMKCVHEFMSYLQNKQSDIQKLVKYQQQQMQQFPLEKTKQQLQNMKLKKLFHLDIYNKIKAKNDDEERLANFQLQQVQRKIAFYEQQGEKMITNKLQIRERSNTLKILQQQTQKKIINDTEQYETHIKQKKQNIQKFYKKIEQNQNKISILNSEINIISSIKERIADLKQKIFVTKQIQKSEIIIHEQLIKDTAKFHLKSQFAAPTKAQQKSQVNKQLLQKLIKDLLKKEQTIKNLIQANSQNARFLSNLKLHQQQSTQILLITYQSNKLTQQENSYLTNYQGQYEVYRQYLDHHPQIQKIKLILKQLNQVHLKKYNQIKQGVQNAKKQYKETNDKLKDFQNMENIRQAQIVQLKKILQIKHNEIVSKTKQYYETQKNFHSFRDVLVGLTVAKPPGSPDKKQTRKTKLNF